ncbi:bifunctional DNA primase/polymerase [Pseudonocardia sp. NPDC049635]|uniref:bifunctional DNA primase/polymerase n=1 Tax=Pseudonocardia sp. NPDC049635 TaxID=3155506 RepID=UPI0033E56D57
MRSATRERAIEHYRSLGLPLFPYTVEGNGFKNWPNPAMMAGFEHLLPKVRVFGVALPSGFVVIDIDADRGGDLAALERAFGALPPTLTVQTPSGPANKHLYFRTAESLRSSTALGGLFPGIDFLGTGKPVKAASSYRLTGDHQREIEVPYYFQRPILEPAPLPAALEQVWRARQSPELEAVGFEESPGGRLATWEKRFVRNQLKRELQRVAEAGPGGRHDVLMSAAFRVFRDAALLGEDPHQYDQKITEAYLESGGTDYPELEKQLHYTKLFAAKNPRCRPSFSARHRDVDPDVAEWADRAHATCKKNQGNKRELVSVLARSARPDPDGRFVVRTAGTVMAEMIKVDQSRVSRFLAELEADGFLHSGSGQYTLEGDHWVPHWRLDQ